MAVDECKLSLLHAKRDTVFARIQTIANKSKDLSDPRIKESFLCDIETVDRLRTDFENILDKINSIESRVNPKYVVNYQPLLTFEDLYCRIKRAAKSLELTQEVQPNSLLIKRDRPKLPPILLPEFNGDIKTWPLFYSSFKTVVHDNPTLSDSEKLHYLIGKLTNRAQSVFAGITPSAENYKIILESLISRYEDKRLLATSYLDQIFELKPSGSANINNLQIFLDKLVTSVSALKNLKVDDLSDLVFLYIALKKLDHETARSFELDNRGSNIPSFDNLVTFVRDQVKILQRTSKEVKKIVDRPTDTTSKPHKPTHYYVNTTTAPSQPRCSLCNSQHEHLYKCSSFQNFTPSERFKFVKSQSYCVNCLSAKHRVSDCRSSSLCRRCQLKHHTMLHFDNRGATPAVGASDGIGETTRTVAVPPPPPMNSPGSIPASLSANGRPEDVALCTFSTNNQCVPTTVLLATARVLMVDAQGREHYVRALLDSASQSNFVSRQCCERLGLKSRQGATDTIVKGIGGTTKTIQGSVQVEFYSRLNKAIKFGTESLIVDKVTERLPTVNVDASMLTSFKGLPLADDTYHTPGDIDVLVGASIFPHLLLSQRIQCESAHVAPFALQTVLGYVIMGTAPAKLNTLTTVSNCCFGESMEATIRKFWELEEVDVPPILSPDDKECEDIYRRTTSRDVDGRYTVALPFKGDPSTLGDSRRLAEKCFFCLERKMLALPSLKQAYDDVIREYLDKGYLSLAPLEAEDSNEPSYIIPHHGVIREDKVTSKIRIVLNASAKTSTSISLNDLLYNGQNLQGNLFNIIVNFRLFPIALSADIRQMFLCIGVRECDRRFQRILYRFSPDEPLKVYQFNRVCFGLKSSPFHAFRITRQLASDEAKTFPNAKETLHTGVYMDDYVYSVDSEEEAISTATEVISLMKAGQFDLVKWTSNSQTVLNSIPPSHRLSSVKEFDESDSHKVLGLNWSHKSDLFSITISKPAEKCTKRTILSCIARIWDLMGFVAPVVLFAKFLIKELWLLNCGWDDVPPDNIVFAWTRFREELSSLEQIEIPRHVGITKGNEIIIVGFADASEKAYGGVVYFLVNVNDVHKVYLMSAKSKVAPRKVVSLARLELCAALLLAKLLS